MGRLTSLQKHILCWQAPVETQWKCSIDSKEWPGDAIAGFGAVLRDCNGTVVAAFSGQSMVGCQMRFEVLLGCRQSL